MGPGELPTPLRPKATDVDARLADHAPLGFTPTPLASLTDLALTLDRRFFVVATALDFLQDALLRHLLLQDLHRFFDGIPNFYFEGASEQCLQAILQVGQVKFVKGEY